MATHLLPCPGCGRHIRALESVCPFCAHTLPMSFRSRPAPSRPRKRLNRAAMFAFGAAITVAPAVGCGGDDEAGPADATPMADRSMPDGMVADGNLPDGNLPDGNLADGNLPDGNAPDAMVDASQDATVDAAADAGRDGRVEDTGVIALYGAIPVDAGAEGGQDAEADGDSGGVMALYGAMPPV